MTDEQAEKISKFMRKECFKRFAGRVANEGRKEAAFDDVRYFRYGEENYAVSVWNTKKEIEPHNEQFQAGEPHITVCHQAYKTPFEKAQSVMCIARLDNKGKLLDERPRWVLAEANTAYECETGRGENAVAQKVDDMTYLRFLGRGDDYSFGVREFTDLTDRDAFSALIIREAKGMQNPKRYDGRTILGESEEKKAERIAREKEALQFYATACQPLMSDEEKARWGRVEKFAKLRRAVKEKRVTLAQKVGARVVRTAKMMSARIGRQ